MTVRPLRRRAAIACASVLSIAVPLAACGGDDDDGGEQAASTASSTSETTSAGHQGPAVSPTTDGGEETTTESTGAAGTVIDVEVSGGSVPGGVERVKVPLGDEVTVRVTADVSDEVHVHGYDLHADVAPGSPGEVTFTADIPGIFEIELEDAGQQLRELEVS